MLAAHDMTILQIQLMCGKEVQRADLNSNRQINLRNDFIFLNYYLLVDK